jgi:hypothetical protein
MIIKQTGPKAVSLLRREEGAGKIGLSPESIYDINHWAWRERFLF